MRLNTPRWLGLHGEYPKEDQEGAVDNDASGGGVFLLADRRRNRE